MSRICIENISRKFLQNEMRNPNFHSIKNNKYTFLISVENVNLLMPEGEWKRNLFHFLKYLVPVF